MVKLIGIREEYCIMCGKKSKVYTLSLNKKSGDCIVAVGLCKECIIGTDVVMQDFINTMLKGNKNDKM